MDGLLLIVIAIFSLGFLLIWAGAHFGGKWFRKRQNSEASAGSIDRKSTRLNSSHSTLSRMPSSA